MTPNLGVKLTWVFVPAFAALRLSLTHHAAYTQIR